jgi:DNA segregation ATPase FtsK/SpoIIIE, S-DNA-T family
MKQNPDDAGTNGSTPAPVIPVVATRRDLQREALENLVQLAKDCAAAEAKIENTWTEAQEKAQRAMDAAMEAGNKKYQNLEQAARKHHELWSGQVGKEFEHSRDSISSNNKKQRQRANHEHETVGEAVKQKLDQSIWLSDSVLEAAEIRIREEHKKAKEQAATAGQLLDDLDDKAKAALVKFGQPVPLVPPSDTPAAAIAENPLAVFENQRDIAQQQLVNLQGLKIPELMSGAKPALLGILVCGAALILPEVIAQTMQPQWAAMGVTAGLAVTAMVGLGVYLSSAAKKQIAECWIPMRQALDAGRRAVVAMSEQADQKRDADYEAAKQQHNSEVHTAKESLNPAVLQAGRKRDAMLLTIRQESAKQLTQAEVRRDAAKAEADDWLRQVMPRVTQRSDRHLQAILDRNDAILRASRKQHDEDRQALEKRWMEGLANIRAPIGDSMSASTDWTQTRWDTWKTPKSYAETLRFGELQVDLQKFVEAAAKGAPFTLPLPGAFSLPAILAFPKQTSLLIHSDAAGRTEAIRTLQLVMVRLLTCMPAGRVRFTIIDPVGLGQNFAGFMHLADFDDQLVGSRIWTSNEQIDQRVTDLTEHMETVIQKYLRNEFETIDQYNAQAGELSEPYRFLVIADFPNGFEAEATRRLSSIASTGARCGVYTLIARDTRAQLPSNSHFEDVQAHSVNIIRQNDRFVWKDEVFRQFPLTFDPPPPEEILTQILQTVGKNAKDANRIEVPFDTIAPKSAQFWSQNTIGDLGVPVGRMGATRLQYFRLGRGVAQHAIIAGKTGSGKSALLNCLITNTALWYSPEEVNLYLIDFKKGVEFKNYATFNFPHAKAIAVESDREFGLSVLQRIDVELNRRGEIFRKAGSQNLTDYRNTPNALPMPRTLLIIDEYQEFFSEDDKLSQEAGLLFERLVRQGRAFGVHLVLGSQTLAGSSGLSRATIGQMAVRVALMCSEADSQLILGDSNSAARLLSRPGEAIYNDAGGLVENNSPFQVAWLPDDKREEMLRLIEERAHARFGKYEPPIVFEGNSPAPISKNTALMQLLEAKTWGAPPLVSTVWVGDPVAIKAPTSVTIRRQSGANILMIGQQEESSMAMLCAMIVALAAEYAPKNCSFVIFDGTPVDSPIHSTLPSIKSAIPHDVKLLEYRGTDEAINELAVELERRQKAEPGASGLNEPEIFFFIYGVQRYRILRKEEESFSFSGGGEEEKKKANTGQQFSDLLREGPSLGIHVVAWADTPISLERTLERAAMREFDHRILFQMSANDSSNLIDSPAANKLGPMRSLVYSEEQGTLEKFRPYALPDKDWIKTVTESLSNRS